MRRVVSLIFFVLVAMVATAQNLPERGEVRKGNRAFEKADYAKATESYAKAAAYAPQSFEANYNYSNGLQKSEAYDKSEEVMAKVVADSLLSRADRADGFFNLGNAQFQQKKYKEALESYKSSLRLNPTDTTAKYNYAYTKRLLEQQQQDQQNQNKDQNKDQQNQDKNKDQQNKDQQDQGDQDKQNQDQNQDQNKGGQDKQDQDQNQDQKDQNKGDQDKQDQNGEPQQQEGGMSDQEQQQILDAIQAQEDKTQDKLQKEKGRGILVPGGKNW